MTVMSMTERPNPIKRIMIKKVVGLIAITLIVIFTVLAVIGLFSFLEWILAEITVAVIANIIFRAVGKQVRQ